MKYEMKKNLKCEKHLAVPSICLLNYIGKLHECKKIEGKRKD